MLVVHSYPEMDPELVDEHAEAEVAGLRSTSRATSAAGGTSSASPAASVLPARVSGGDATPPHELVGAARPALASTAPEGEALATFGSVEILAIGRGRRRAGAPRIAERRDAPASEVARAEGKLANERFVDKAPADVVEAERAKLAAYQAELEELGG